MNLFEHIQLSLSAKTKGGKNDISSVIIEGIQGVGGINVASDPFLRRIRNLCDQYDAVFIADSVQCGYGRSGKFFSHDYAGVSADIYTMAKGMGNGFPVAGIIIAPHIKPKHFQLGTTFGGNHLACAAALAVLEVIEEEKEGTIVKIGGIIESTRRIFTKKTGSEMAFLVLANEKGIGIEIIVFQKVFEQYKNEARDLRPEVPLKTSSDSSRN